jgi:DNA-binding NarL/FixJ family response regulator
MPKSVLIVDDSAVIRKLIHHCVKTQTDWAIVGEAEDGLEAIKKAVGLNLDLVFLDFSMPVMNGLEAAPVLKKMMPNARIILFTMYCDSLGSVFNSETGVDLIVPKSDGLTNLVRSVLRLLENGGSSKSNTGQTREEPDAGRRH